MQACMRLQELGVLPEMPKRRDGSTVDWAKPILDAWDCSEAAALRLLETFCKEGERVWAPALWCTDVSSRMWPLPGMQRCPCLTSAGREGPVLPQGCSTTSCGVAMQTRGLSAGCRPTCAGASSARATCTSRLPRCAPMACASGRPPSSLSRAAGVGSSAVIRQWRCQTLHASAARTEWLPAAAAGQAAAAWRPGWARLLHCWCWPCARSGTGIHVTLLCLLTHALLWQAGGKQVSKTFWRRLTWRDLAYWQLHHWGGEMCTQPIRSHYADQVRFCCCCCCYLPL